MRGPADVKLDWSKIKNMPAPSGKFVEIPAIIPCIGTIAPFGLLISIIPGLEMRSIPAINGASCLSTIKNAVPETEDIGKFSGAFIEAVLLTAISLAFDSARAC